jgi:tetratricopeptide (TPR) repeat protein
LGDRPAPASSCFAFYNNDGSCTGISIAAENLLWCNDHFFAAWSCAANKKDHAGGHRAFNTFQSFVGKKKFDFEKHLKFAIYYNEQKRFPETISEANSAKNVFFTIDITSNPVELNSGVAYKEMKNYDAALKELKTALSYRPYNNRTYNNLRSGFYFVS